MTAISMTVHVLISLSEAKFSIAGSVSHIVYPCLWHMYLSPLCLGRFHTRARKIQGSWNRHHQALAMKFFLYFLICHMEVCLFLVRPLQVKAQKHFSSEIQSFLPDVKAEGTVHTRLCSCFYCQTGKLLYTWKTIRQLENYYQKNMINLTKMCSHKNLIQASCKLTVPNLSCFQRYIARVQADFYAHPWKFCLG